MEPGGSFDFKKRSWIGEKFECCLRVPRILHLECNTRSKGGDFVITQREKFELGQESVRWVMDIAEK